MVNFHFLKFTSYSYFHNSLRPLPLPSPHPYPEFPSFFSYINPECLLCGPQLVYLLPSLHLPSPMSEQPLHLSLVPLLSLPLFSFSSSSTCNNIGGPTAFDRGYSLSPLSLSIHYHVLIHPHSPALLFSIWLPPPSSLHATLHNTIFPSRSFLSRIHNLACVCLSRTLAVSATGGHLGRLLDVD